MRPPWTSGSGVGSSGCGPARGRRTSGRSRRRSPRGSCRRRRATSPSAAITAGFESGPGARVAASARSRRGQPRGSSRSRDLPSAPATPSRAAGSALAPRAAIARASSVSEGASAMRWTTRARSRPRVIGLDWVGSSSRRRRVEQPADIVEERGAGFGDAVLVAVAVGEEKPLAWQRQAGMEQIALLGVGVAPRLQAQGPALAFGEEGVGAGSRRAGTHRPGGRRRRRGRSAPPARRWDRRSAPAPSTGPCQTRARIAESARARESGRGARPASSARSAIAVAIAPAARALELGVRPARPSPTPSRRPRRRAPGARRRPPAPGRRRRAARRTAPPRGRARRRLSPCAVRRTARSNQSTRPGGAPEGPRR